MFDYVNGITIGSIAAEMATSLENDFLKPLTAMIIYTAASIIISYVSCKSEKLCKFLQGSSLILYQNGKLYEKNLKHAKLDINEFLIQCRNSGYFELSNVETAIFEPNGQISFLPKSKYRPATPSDLNLMVPEDKLVLNVILDGKIMYQNLKYTGNNETWLKNELKFNGVKKIDDVFLATCDLSNKLNIYKKNNKEILLDPFQ